MTIVEFLLARIDEDEADADAEDEDYGDTSLLPTLDSDHQARWETDRVRAECAAKRAIVEHFDDPDYDNYPLHEARRVTLGNLAAVYADHPAYDPAWRVE